MIRLDVGSWSTLIFMVMLGYVLARFLRLCLGVVSEIGGAGWWAVVRCLIMVWLSSMLRCGLFLYESGRGVWWRCGVLVTRCLGMCLCCAAARTFARSWSGARLSVFAVVKGGRSGWERVTNC